ncbi:MAG: DNA starvation/stationary phase protection protein [Proteobacteria bacterium]|nr:DNA starvation/stationary phase protection protein [Pseudomonadota bacterium]
MKDKFVLESLKEVLADSYALYTKTQNYHWNVEGPHFQDIHNLLELQYTDLATAIDEIAEHIRMLGAKAPGTWSAYTSITKIQEGTEDSSATDMLTHLLKDQELIIKTLNKCIKAAQNAQDEVIIGALTDRVSVHRKNHWMLQSMLK